LCPLPLADKESFTHRFIRSINTDWNTPGQVRFSIPGLVPSQELSILRDAAELALHFTVTGCNLENYQRLTGMEKTIETQDPSAVIPASSFALPYESAPHSVYLLTAGWSYRLHRKNMIEGAPKPGVQMILSAYYSGRING
ncbi:MAG TPA: hypothetical protein VF145_09320, partial [Chitinophagaceae bacterium]